MYHRYIYAVGKAFIMIIILIKQIEPRTMHRPCFLLFLASDTPDRVGPVGASAPNNRIPVLSSSLIFILPTSGVQFRCMSLPSKLASINAKIIYIKFKCCHIVNTTTFWLESVEYIFRRVFNFTQFTYNVMLIRTF